MHWSDALLAAALVVGAFLSSAGAQTPSAERFERGRLIYERGRLASGEPLVADRGGGVVSTGEAAACIKCHQRSGYGLFEATNLVPAITGPALFDKVRPKSQAPRHAEAVLAGLSRPLHPPCRHLQPPADQGRRRWRHLHL